MANTGTETSARYDGAEPCRQWLTDNDQCTLLELDHASAHWQPVSKRCVSDVVEHVLDRDETCDCSGV